VAFEIAGERDGSWRHSTTRKWPQDQSQYFLN